MKRIYYVIVDLSNLCYVQEGNDVISINDADKFDSYIEAVKELESYDSEFNGAIYEVVEFIDRQLNLVRKDDISGR